MDHDRPRAAPTFFEYLYDPLPVNYPILRHGATVTDRILEAERELLRAFSGRT